MFLGGDTMGAWKRDGQARQQVCRLDGNEEKSAGDQRKAAPEGKAAVLGAAVIHHAALGFGIPVNAPARYEGNGGIVRIFLRKSREILLVFVIIWQKWRKSGAVYAAPLLNGLIRRDRRESRPA